MLKYVGLTVAIAVFGFGPRFANAASIPVSEQPRAPAIEALQQIAANLMSGADQAITAITGTARVLAGAIEAHLRNAPVSHTAAAAVPTDQPAVQYSPPSSTPQQELEKEGTASPVASPQSPIVNQTIVEQPIQDGATDSRLNALIKIVSDLASLLPSLGPAPAQTATVSQAVAADGNPEAIGAGAAINQLAGAAISDPTITGGSITASSIVGTIGNAIDSALGEIDNLTSNTITATNATTTNLVVTGTSTLAGINLTAANCSSYGNGGKLTTDAFGNVVCAADQGGSGSTVAGSDTQIQFNDGGSFGANSSLTFNKTNSLLTVANASTTDLSVATDASLGNATSTSLFSPIADFTNAVISTLNASVANIVGFTATNATTSSLYVTSVKGAILKTDANGQVAAAVAGTDYQAPLSVTNDTNVTGSVSGGTFTLGWTGMLGVGRGGTGTSTAPAFGQVLIGNGSGGYTLTATSSLGILAGGAWGSITGTLANQSDLQSALNLKLSSSSIASSAELAGLLSDETGSGSAVFATSPTFAGTPTFGGGIINYSANSTSTVPNGTPYAWTIATSTSASPLVEVDSSGSSGAVSLGSSYATSSTVVIGASNQPSILQFEGTSTIEGAGTGQEITIGANSDVVDFGVNVGIGTTSPGSILSIAGVGNWTGATSTYYSSGGINITSGCFSIDGVCIGGGPTDTFSYPLINTANVVSLAFGTTTANIWSQLQTFGAGASTSNLTISNITNGSSQCLQIDAFGQVSGTGSACGSGGGGATPGGSSGQIQFDNSGAFGGANLWWDNTNTRLGIGTSSPYAELSVATPAGASGSVSTLFAISSSTAGAATTTLFSIDNMGNTVDTLAASSTFAVGANGAVNPAFQIFASTTNAATGLALISNWAGNGVTLQAVSSAANENLTVKSKANGASLVLLDSANTADVNISGVTKLSISSATDSFTNGGHSGSSASDFLVNDSADTGITSGAEDLFNEFNIPSGTHEWKNGNVALQRDFAVLPGTHLMTSASTTNNFGTLDTAYIGGAPLLGNWATSTNEYTLYLDASALNASTTNSYGLGVFANSGAQRNYAAEFLGGNVGVGTSTPTSQLEVWGPDNASTSAFAVINSASTTEFTVYDTGNAVLAGSLTQNSDERLKTDIQDLDGSSSLAEIDALDPVTFNWIDPEKSSVPQLGFIAQQVQGIFPNLVATTAPTALTPDGTLSLNYIDLISPIVSAIQELSQEIADLAEHFFSQQVSTNELCVGSTCVTPTQFEAMVAAANQSESATSASPSSPAATDTPPVIEIDGDNPAIVQVGATYNDLGATITGPQADLNLGITTYVDGAEMDPAQIDTSAAATDTIDYVVTDENGLASTSTRTVIVEAPTQSNQSADDSSPATDATTTEDASSSPQ